MVGSLSQRDGGVGRPSRRGGRPSRKGRMGREALPKGREGLGVPSAGPGGDATTSRRTGRERDALPRNQEWSGVPPSGQAEVGRPSQVTYRGWEVLLEHQQRSRGALGGSAKVRKPSQRVGGGRSFSRRERDYSEGRVGVGRLTGGLHFGQHGYRFHPLGLMVVRKPSRRAEDYSGRWVGVGRPSWRARSVLEAVPVAQWGQGVSPEGWIGFGRPSQRAGGCSGGPGGVGRDGRGWEALPKGTGRVGRPSWRARRCREALLEGWKGLGGSPEEPEGWGGPHGRPGRVPKSHPQGLEGTRCPPGGPGGNATPFRGAGRGWEALSEGRLRSGAPPR